MLFLLINIFIIVVIGAICFYLIDRFVNVDSLKVLDPERPIREADVGKPVLLCRTMQLTGEPLSRPIFGTPRRTLDIRLRRACGRTSGKRPSMSALTAPTHD
jgi:hypothetical protein